MLLAIVQWNGAAIAKPLTARSIIIGGPLVVNDDEVLLRQLMEEYCRLLPPYVVYSEIRPVYDMGSIEESLNKQHFRRVGHYNLMLDIRPNKQRLFDNLHKERQRNIRQAQKAGLRFEEVTSEQGINEIAELIRQTYIRKRVPFADTGIFSYAAESMSHEVRFFAAYKDNTMVAGQVRLCYKKLVYAWYAGSDERYFRLRPNDFLMWNVICWAHDHGYSTFDFGGGGEPGRPYGVRDYKLKYGCKIFDYGRYLNVRRPLTYYLAKSAMKLLGMKK